MPARPTYLFAAVVLIGALIHPAIGHAASRGIDVTLKASEAPAPSGGTNMEALFWRSIQAGGDIESHEAYLSRYPKGTFAALARVKIDKLKQQKQLAVADPPKPPAPSPVKPAVEVFPKKTGQVFRDCFDCPEMVVIPAGSFRMGDLDGGGGSDAKPVHGVTIPRPFAVGRYEVTFTEWDACFSAGGCGHHPKDRGWGRDSHPVINVSWNDAKEYVDWLSRKTGQEYRLPSESEWEYAARAGTGTKWSCGNRGDCLQGVAWYAGNSESMTHPVGQKGANGFGLYDMQGNVWEWVEDCKLRYSGTPTDGSAETVSSACYRVNRGGSWYSYTRLLRAAFRNGNNPIIRDNGLGFRLARTLLGP
ncbi:MAG: formylglycine-generating enzyme family protein [Rhodospirillales bacterium]